MSYIIRPVTMLAISPNASANSSTSFDHATSDDIAMRNALLRFDGAFAYSPSLETTANLLAARFTKKGTYRKRNASVRAREYAAVDASNASNAARREAYWKITRE